jgi:hypothetical protein
VLVAVDGSDAMPRRFAANLSPSVFERLAGAVPADPSVFAADEPAGAVAL